LSRICQLLHELKAVHRQYADAAMQYFRQSMSSFDLVIKPRGGWQPIDVHELWRYRELLGFLVWRDIKVRYKQTLLGGGWAVLQPLIGMLVFGTLFTTVAPIRSDGSPYPLFVFAGLAPWTFFANALGLASNSLVGSEHMIRKIYFPRIFVPLGATFALGLDMLISVAFMGLVMAYYRWPVSPKICLLPIFIASCFLIAGGLGLILSALNVRYRDVKYVVPFFTQMAFFLTPVIYPLRNVPPRLKMLVGLNPMAGTVEGFRYALLGSPASWDVIWTSLIVSVVIFVIGLYSFRRLELTFADLI
jgi:lipopolysaccharide transport system permease protein